MGARWIVNNDESAEVVLRKEVELAALRSPEVRTTSGGGLSGDNWEMNLVVVSAFVGSSLQEIKRVGFKRFKGEDRKLVIPINDMNTAPGQMSKLQLTIATGGDDLRGGNDNLNVFIRYRDGRTQSLPNVNGSRHWGNDSTNLVSIDIDPAVPPEDVVEVTLQTTSGGDNWTMNWIRVAAVGNSLKKTIFEHGEKRFTGDDKSLTLS